MVGIEVQYIIVGLILCGVIYYLIRHVVHLFKGKGGGKCDSCAMNQGCNLDKRKK